SAVFQLKNWVIIHLIYKNRSFACRNFIKMNGNLQKKLAIVILNWNGKDHLKNFLPSVLTTSYHDFEVYVVDNGSVDDSLSLLRNEFPQVKIIELKQNFGFAKGYNLGLQQISAEYYVLLNSDVEITPDWAMHIIDLMDSDKTIAACQPKILQYTNRSFFEYAGAAGGWIDSFGYPFARGRIFDICVEDNNQYDEAQPVFWASGAAMFVRSDAWHELYGLDEYFFAHQEEIDFCWRLQHAGYKVYSCPKSVVYHVGGGTLPKGNKKKVYLNFRNNLIMLAKNLPPVKRALIILFRMVLDGISAIKSLFAGEVTYFKSIVKAHLGFYKWIFLKKDKRFNPVKKSSKKMQGKYRGSVVWQHFILGKTKFEEIVNK